MPRGSFNFYMLSISSRKKFPSTLFFRFYENRFPKEKTCFAVKPKYVTREKRFASLNFYQILSQLLYQSAKPVSEHSRETDINAFSEHGRMHANNAELLHDFESFSICSLRIVLKVTEKRKLRQQNEQKAGRNCVSLKYTFEFLQIKVLNDRITKTENGQPYDSREPFNLWFKDT